MLPAPQSLASTVTRRWLLHRRVYFRVGFPQQIPHAFVSAKVADGPRGQDGTDVQRGREESFRRRQAVRLRPEGRGALEERGGHVSSGGIPSKENGGRTSGTVVEVVAVVPVGIEEDFISVSMAPFQGRHDVVLHFVECRRAVLAASRDDFLEKEQREKERCDDARRNGDEMWN